MPDYVVLFTKTLVITGSMEVSARDEKRAEEETMKLLEELEEKEDPLLGLLNMDGEIDLELDSSNIEIDELEDL